MHPGVKLRNKIIKEKNLELIKVFDTNEYEQHKDVALVEDSSGRKMILRCGETRNSKDVFPEGYQGEHFIIPEIYQLQDKKDERFELVEYISGDMISSMEFEQGVSQLMEKNMLEKLIEAHWEFQQVAQDKMNEKLKPTWKKENLSNFFETGKQVIDEILLRETKRIVESDKYDWFWQPNYPAKWKFALDNLILTAEGKIGFVDLAKIGKRFWGYDLGWLFWPNWHHFSEKEMQQYDKYYETLQDFFDLVYQHAPEPEQNDEFYTKCNLVLFERIIGSTFDIVNETGHLMKFIKNQENFKENYAHFLNGLLSQTLKDIE